MIAVKNMLTSEMYKVFSHLSLDLMKAYSRTILIVSE